MWSAESYRWHFDYVRLAWDTQFSFERQKCGNTDKGGASLIDIDRIIKERDISSVERNISLVLQYTLEREQAALLDQNFVKLFQLGQLIIQYLLFCKKYLDNTVVLLKKELNSIKDQNQQLREFNDELKDQSTQLLKKLKRKRSSESIAAYKCDKCLKMFSSEKYLEAHQKRRHLAYDNSIISELTNESEKVTNETDRLQSEIKLLKERLNTAERFIQHEQTIKPPKETNRSSNHIPSGDDRIDELFKKFEIWKNQVDGELKLIQSQHNFEEKYEKWFESALEKLKEALPSKKNEETKDIDTRAHDEIPDNSIKVESGTQTDNLLINDKDDKSVSCVLINSDSDEKIKLEGENSRKIQQKNNGIDVNALSQIQEQVDKFESSLNLKVEESLHQLQQRVEMFYHKFQDVQNVIAVQPQSSLKIEVNTEKNIPDYSEKIIEMKPPIKPRTKFTVSKRNSSNLQNEKIDPVIQVEKTSDLMIDSVMTNEKDQQLKSQLKETIVEVHNVTSPQVNQSRRKSEMTALDRYSSTDVSKIKSTQKKVADVSKQKSDSDVQHTVNRLQNFLLASSSTDSEESESEESSEETDEQVEQVQKSHKSHKSPSNTPKKTKQYDHKNAVSKSKTEINNLVNSRLQEIGISPEWKGLPERTFRRALDIVRHQSTLLQKNYVNYSKTKKTILRAVDMKLKDQEKYTKKVFKNSTSRKNGVTDKRKNGNKVKVKDAPTTAEYINEMYNTDTDESETETKFPPPLTVAGSSKLTPVRNLTSIPKLGFSPPKDPNEKSEAYSAVISELKSRNSKTSESEDTDSSITSKVVEEKEPTIQTVEETQENRTKSALKNYPSVGSLKKKVLFDLESLTSPAGPVVEKTMESRLKDGGSTTSVASSVFDGSPRKDKSSKIEENKQSKSESNDLEDLSDFDF